MKLFLLFTIAFTSHYLSFAQTSDPVNLKLNDQWFAGEAEIDNYPVIIRGRSHLKNIMESQLYNELLQVTWTFEEPTEKGLPSQGESALMASVEDALVETLESDLQSVLVAVQTFKGERTWFYYTQSTQEFLQRLNGALSSFDRLPLNITNDSDEEWSVYLSILEDFGLEPK